MDPQSTLSDQDRLQVAELEAEIAKLMHQKEELMSSYDVQLPPPRIQTHGEEVLKRIFIHALPTERNLVLSSKEMPMVLSRVCRLWWDVARSTPALWARLHVPMPSDSTYRPIYIADDPPLEPYQESEWRIMGRQIATMQCQRRVEGITQWLDRAKGQPLSLSIYWGEDAAVHDDVARRILSATLPYSRQWREVYFELPFDREICASVLASLREDDVPILTNVHLRDSNSRRQEPMHPAWANAEILLARDLRVLTMERLESLPGMPVRWSTLTELVVKDYTSLNHQSAAALLRRCVMLVKCYIDIYPRSLNDREISSQPIESRPSCPSFGSKTDPIHLPHITTLILIDRSGFEGYLLLPRLRFLEYQTHQQCRDLEDTLGFLLTKATALETFHLHLDATDFSLLHGFLKCISKTLRRMALIPPPSSIVVQTGNSGIYWRSALPANLLKSWNGSHWQGGEVLFPNLESLEFIYNFYDIPQADDILIRFLEQRESMKVRRGGNGLRDLAIHFHEPITNRMAAYMEQLRRKEWSISLRYPDVNASRRLSLWRGLEEDYSWEETPGSHFYDTILERSPFGGMVQTRIVP